MDARDTAPANSKLRTLVETPGFDDLSTVYTVRTVWFAEDGDTVLEHEENFGWNRAEAQAWIDCSV